MASTDDVQKLAALARLSIDDAQLEKFSKEFESILSYVGQIESLDTKGEEGALPAVHNVFREDGIPNEKGSGTELIASQFPQRDGNALVVEKIISHD